MTSSGKGSWKTRYACSYQQRLGHCNPQSAEGHFLPAGLPCVEAGTRWWHPLQIGRKTHACVQKSEPATSRPAEHRPTAGPNGGPARLALRVMRGLCRQSRPCRLWSGAMCSIQPPTSIAASIPASGRSQLFTKPC